MKKTSLLLITCITFCSTLIAQDKKDAPKWDVSNPQGTYKDVNFTTSEGTWMNLDVSPDGKEIIFDLGIISIWCIYCFIFFCLYNS